MPPPSSPALTEGTRLGPYEVLTAIGGGGMGEVYRARDTRLDRVVAIKVLAPSMAADPELRERFEREARAISSLNHPNICVLHDVGRGLRVGRNGPVRGLRPALPFGGDVAPDGRFLFVVPPKSATVVTRPRIVVVQNWVDELRARVPVPSR